MKRAASGSFPNTFARVLAFRSTVRARKWTLYFLVVVSQRPNAARGGTRGTADLLCLGLPSITAVPLLSSPILPVLSVWTKPGARGSPVLAAQASYRLSTSLPGTRRCHQSGGVSATRKVQSVWIILAIV